MAEGCGDIWARLSLARLEARLSSECSGFLPALAITLAAASPDRHRRPNALYFYGVSVVRQTNRLSPLCHHLANATLA